MPQEYLTAEQAKGMVEDVIGQSLEKYHKDWEDRRHDFLKDIAYVARNQPPDKSVPLTPQQKREKAVVLIGSIIQGGGDPQKAAEIAKAIGEERISKALGTSTVAGGSILIEPEMASEMIELLRADAVVMASGARSIPMESGILNYGKVGSGATAAYRGESVAGTVSGPTAAEVSLKAKLLTVMFPASNQLLNRSRGKGAAFLQDELVAAASDKMDATFIRSDGSADKPKGLLYQAASANKYNETNVAGTSGGSTFAERVYILGKMMGSLATGNVKGISLGWLLAPRTWQTLFTQLDSNGNHVWKDEMINGTLYGIPFKRTSNIPVNLTAAAGSGAGSDASELYLADFFDVLVGETEGLSISTSTEASYVISGTTYSCFQRGETLVKVEMEHDLAVRHPEAVAVCQSLTWGTV